MAQLRTANPPFDEAEITRERLALEEAVRSVEEEAKQRRRYDRVSTFSYLVDADDLGNVPPMIVMGGAIGRLTRIWRWRSRARA